MRDRERTREAAEQAALGDATANGAPSSPSRASRRQPKLGTGGRATADVLQDLYLKARIREAEEAKRQEEKDREARLT